MADEEKAPASETAESLDKRGTDMDVWIAWGAWASIIVALAVVVCNIDVRSATDRMMLVLAGTGGGALGWAAGIILTPYDAGENRTFKGIGQGVYGLVTGYAVAKVDPAVTAMVAGAIKDGVPTLAVMQAAIALITFVGAATVTFVSRKYWRERKPKMVRTTIVM